MKQVIQSSGVLTLTIWVTSSMAETQAVGLPARLVFDRRCSAVAVREDTVLSRTASKSNPATLRQSHYDFIVCDRHSLVYRRSPG